MSRTAHGVRPLLVRECRIVAGARVEMTEDGHAGGTATRIVLEIPEAQALIDNGRQAGSLSSEQIALALDDLGLDAAQLDDFYTTLDDLQIEVVTAEEEDTAPTTGG